MGNDNIFNHLSDSKIKDEITEQKEQWKVLIVDDEKAIHTVIRLALDDFIFKGKNIQFFVADSATNAKKILKQQSDIALILLDVVMETNTAGLDLVKFIREELQNHFIQIVLWTGQPGQAPKREVIFSYEINDYKTKIELNDDNIFTTVLASLRTYNAIITLESFRQSLEQKVIERTKEVVAQKKKITDSILCAQNIQNAILPSEESIIKICNDFFILFKPKDIVSGDFYWIKKIKNCLVIAAVDCTGHGVPGAFMSMLGVALLNEIVRKKEIIQPGQVLNDLREYVKNYLNQTGEKSKSRDGMDMALCTIDTQSLKMQYAGANNPVYLIRKSNLKNDTAGLIELEPDPMPIGIYIKEEQFKNNEIQLKPNDCLYFFSDGFIDQFGGKKNNKFMKARFNELLLEIYKKPMPEQKNILEKTFYDWKGSNFQIDDVLVMGIRI